MTAPDPSDPHPRHGHRTPADIAADEAGALGPVQSVPPKGDRTSNETEEAEQTKRRVPTRDTAIPRAHVRQQP